MAFLKKPLKWTALGQEPSELKKNEGFKMDESPAPGHFDFMFRSTYEAIEELQQKAGEVKTVNNALPNAAGNISVTKSTVGLSNVDNTSDVNKPISNATKAELDKKYTKPATGIPKTDLSTDVQASLVKAESALQSVTKADVGLSNVDNTSDASKPISNAQAAKFSEVEGALTTHKADNVLHNTYVTCATASATAEKVVTASGFTLVAGARITVNFTNANSALSPTLKINTNVAKPVIQNDGKPFEKILSGVYEFLYNGTSFIALNSGGGEELPDLVKGNGMAIYDLAVNNQLTKLPTLSSNYKNVVVSDVLYSFNANKLYTTDLKTYAQSVIDLPADLTANSNIFRVVSIDKFIYLIAAVNGQDFRKYDTTNNTWTKITLPTTITSDNRNASNLSADGTYIFFTGVFGVVRYNPSSGIFNTETTAYPNSVYTSAGYLSGASYTNGNIYALGYANKLLAIYNITSKTWSYINLNIQQNSGFLSKVVIISNRFLALTFGSLIVIYDYVASVAKVINIASSAYEWCYLNDNTLINVLPNGYFYLAQLTEG